MAAETPSIPERTQGPEAVAIQETLKVLGKNTEASNELKESVYGSWFPIAEMAESFRDPASAADGANDSTYTNFFNALKRATISEVKMNLAKKINEFATDGTASEAEKEYLQAFVTREIQKMDARLREIAAKDSAEGGKISLFDLKKASGLRASLPILSLLADKERSASPAQVKEYIKNAVMQAALNKSMISVDVQENDKSNPKNLLTRELQFLTIQLVGSKQVSLAEYENMLKEVMEDLENTGGIDMFAGVQDGLNPLLETETVRNEQTGEDEEVARVIRMYNEQQQGKDIANMNADASGTMLGKFGNLTEIFFYFGKDLAVLSAVAQLMDPRLKGMPWQQALFFIAATETVKPGTLNSIFGSPDNMTASLEQTRELSDFPGVDPKDVPILEMWARTIDPKYFDKNHTELDDYLTQQLSAGGHIDFDKLADFLPDQTANDTENDIISPSMSRASAAERRQKHDLAVPTDPRAKQALFNFLRAATRHHKQPNSILN